MIYKCFGGKRVLFSYFLFLFVIQSNAQTQLVDKPNKNLQRLTFGLGHTSISNGEINGKTTWLPLASWSLNYDYWLNNKWAVGLQSDLILETFLVKQKSGNSIERKNPVAVVPVTMYRLSNHWVGIVGAGVEFSKGHNLGLTRLGIEYGVHLPKNWEVGAALVWDNKWNYYNSWGIAFTCSKLFNNTLH